MEKPSDPIAIGEVGAPHGVRGTIRVRATGSGRHLREGATPLVGGLRRRIEKCRATPKGFLIDLEGIKNREEAASLRGEELVVDRSELDDLEEGEFYVGDLIGMKTVNEAGELVGEVTEILESPAHEILVSSSPDGEIYVPFTLVHVPQVDAVGGRIVVSLPEA